MLQEKNLHILLVKLNTLIFKESRTPVYGFFKFFYIEDINVLQLTLTGMWVEPVS